MGKKKKHNNNSKINRDIKADVSNGAITEETMSESAVAIAEKTVPEPAVVITEKTVPEPVVTIAEKTVSEPVVKVAEKTVPEPVITIAEKTAAENEVADEEPAYNRRNVNRIKKAILITALLLIVIPMCLSILLFVKVNKLEKELKECREELSEKNTETQTIEEDKEKLSEDDIKDNIEYQISMYADAKNNLLQSREDFEFVTVEESDTEESSILIDPSEDALTDGTADANTDGTVDAQTSGQENIDQASTEDSQETEDGTENTQDMNSVENGTTEEEQQVPLNGKKVYLTFDDGPSGYTEEILDILEEKGVKATFFVVGKEEEYYPEYQRIVEDGHSIGIHSYSHVYDTVYKNLDYFKNDVESMHDLIYNVTGYDAWLYRFPGGSSNKVSGVNIQDCMKYLDENGYVYFDWNAQNGDAVSYYISPDQLNYNVMGFVRSNPGDTVVLMHDLGSHHNTVEALPYLIDTLKAEGYEILPITRDTTPVRHVQYEGDK